MLEDYLPRQVNSGPWVLAYTLYKLRDLPPETEFVLPICSIGTPYSEMVNLGDYILPPLFHEALNDDLKHRLIERILECFPFYKDLNNRKRVKVIELRKNTLPEREAPQVLAFSVDTAVEEHGPHLPLGTDTIQSYSVLRQLAENFERFELAKPLEYGQLTWGLPFGFSVDITTDLLTQYVTGYCNALLEWRKPESLYVVDVHGSMTHRQAIVKGIQQSQSNNWAFRWMHDPIQEFSSSRGDQHAGGVETILVERVTSELLDSDWWPSRIDDLADHQMSFEKAVELTPQLETFFEYVTDNSSNGIIGDIKNYHQLDPKLLFETMLNVARQDVQNLRSGDSPENQNAGQELW